MDTSLKFLTLLQKASRELVFRLYFISLDDFEIDANSIGLVKYRKIVPNKKYRSFKQAFCPGILKLFC
jgi:hypothetical protein